MVILRVVPVHGVNDVFLPMGNLPDGTSEGMARAICRDGDWGRKEGDRVWLGVFQLDDAIKVRFDFGGGWWVEEPC